MATSIFRFVSIILAALLAGTSFGIWMGFNPSGFTPSTYIETQQHTVRTLHTLMVSLVIAATITTLISAFLQKRNKTVFIALLIAAAAFISCILISRFGNKPIQDEMLGWNAASLPANWESLRDKWWSLHVIRTMADLLGLVLVVWAGITKKVLPLSY